MGGAVATPLSAPLNSTTHPRTRTLGATALVPGERLPAPYTLNSEEEARAAGYTEQQIHSYLASFEYFQRTNKAEASPARSSLVLYDPEPALLLPGAAGLVLPRSNGGVPAAGTATAAAAAAAAAALPPHVQRARALTGGHHLRVPGRRRRSGPRRRALGKGIGSAGMHRRVPHRARNFAPVRPHAAGEKSAERANALEREPR